MFDDSQCGITRDDLRQELTHENASKNRTKQYVADHAYVTAVVKQSYV